MHLRIQSLNCQIGGSHWTRPTSHTVSIVHWPRQLCVLVTPEQLHPFVTREGRKCSERHHWSVILVSDSRFVVLRWTRRGPVRIQVLWEALLVILSHVQTSLCLLHYLSISLCHLSDSELLRLRLIQCSCPERSASPLVPAGSRPAYPPGDHTLSACLYSLVFPLFIHSFFLYPHLLPSLYCLTCLPLFLPHVSLWFVVTCHKWIGNCLVTTWVVMVHFTLQQHYGWCVLAALPPWS